MKRSFKYTLSREGKYYVANCLNVEVSSFGESIDEALKNLKEALELYSEDQQEYRESDVAIIGELLVEV